jgi:hypothetical protein
MQRLLDACKDTGMTQPAVMWVDDQVEIYRDVRPPENWKKFCSAGHLETCRLFNNLFRLYPTEPYYGFLEDDVVPLQKGWDVEIANAAGDWNVVYCHDGAGQANLRITAIGGEFIRALGYICPPGFVHLYADNVLTDLANALQVGVYRKDIIMDHKHFSRGAPVDDTYRRIYQGKPYADSDRAAYGEWREKDYPAAVERMKKAMVGP